MGEALGSAPRAELMTREGFERYWPEISRELDLVPHIWTLWYTKESLRLGVLAGVYQVWAFGSETQTRVVVFTQIAEYPAARVLMGFLALGNGIDEFLPLMQATFERVAMAAECDRCELVGREGWGRKVKGLKKVSALYIFELPDRKVH